MAWLKVVWYVLAVTSVVVFAYGVRAAVGEVPPRAWRRSAAGRASCPGCCGGDSASCSRTRTIGRRDHDRRAGVTERSSTASSSLFAGTVILGFDTDFTTPVFGWSYFHGDFYLIYKEMLNVFGTVADRRACW